MSPRIDELNVLIVDDELPARTLLSSLLERLGVCAVTAVDSGHAAISHMTGSTPPDLLFLDIEMPEMTGFQLVEQIGIAKLPPTIFITAYDQYAVRAFEVNAVDYLLKPYSIDRLRMAIEKAAIRHQRERSAHARRRLNRLIAHWDSPSIPATGEHGSLLRLPVRNGRTIDAIPISAIEWVLSADHYVTVSFDGRKELVYARISDMEEQLDPTRFIRIHRRCIVHIAHVASIRTELHGRYSVLMRDGTSLPMSRHRTFQLARLLSAKV